MLVGFNPYMSNNRNQKTSFGAVNQEYLQAAKKAVQNKNTYYYPVRDLEEAYGLQDISKADSLDTLAEIKKIYPEKFHNIVNNAITWVNEFKWTS